MPYKNPEDRKAQQHRWRETNKERLREYQRQYQHKAGDFQKNNRGQRNQT